ncbi:MAG: 2Fe-2S iron-sulfur cluster binding domain-containing protein [Candidatus Izimaplasma sp.]|nr:2Fe-2S iron-sulfur cluster binding domain-containing protein [Candidatus Izimaplasma bacterium]
MNLFVPLIIVGVLIVISIILLLIQSLLGSDEENKVTINEKDEINDVDGETLLNALAKDKIFIPSACGGKATCGLCKVKVTEGGGQFKPTEDPFIDEKQKEEGIRLSCQVKVRGNVRVEIPDELLDAKEYKAKVTHLDELTYDTKLLGVTLIKPEIMEFRPGQYAQLRVPGVEAIRAYSIASNPKNKSNLEFIIRYVPKGTATTFVHKALDIGDTITLTGPFGDFFLQEDSDRNIICIAGGSGKAPIRSILSYLSDKNMPRKVKYFFGAVTEEDLYYTKEFRELEEQYSNFKYIPCLSNPKEDTNWTGDVGLVTDVVRKHMKDLSEHEAYLCGSPGMIDACINVLDDLNMPEEQIFYDKFS